MPSTEPASEPSYLTVWNSECFTTILLATILFRSPTSVLDGRGNNYPSTFGTANYPYFEDNTFGNGTESHERNGAGRAVGVPT